MSGGDAREIYIDASGHILGRLASYVAKRLLEGYRVYVFNVEKIVVSGKRTMVVESYKRTVLGVKSHFSHKWRPKRPRSPVRLFKHAVRGMLPKDNKRGRDALRRLRAYIGVPDEFRGKNLVRIQQADASRLSRWYVELAVVAKQLGWKGGGR